MTDIDIVETVRSGCDHPEGTAVLLHELADEIERLRDFARNVAGLDDRLLQNTAILKQWRDDARKLLG
jgi:hypothetical protein